VTDLDETTVQPDLIATHYLTGIDEVTEHLRAAAVRVVAVGVVR
jgi:ABC-type hemin transport system substrate-binding protein